VNRELARAGVRAADFFLKDFFGLSPISKAPSILTPVGFDRTVLGLLGELQKETGAQTKAALTGFLSKLNQDWPSMTPEARSKAIEGAGKTYLGLTAGIGPDVADVLKKNGPTIVGNTKADTRKRDNLDIGIELSGVDHRVIEASANHQALYVRDQFGARSVRYSQMARDVVTKGLEDGLDRYDIGKDLAKTFVGTDGNRNDAYWQLIASVFTARSRTYGQLAGFQEAGIDTFQFESVLDERTSEVCRFMHGRTFSVSNGLRGYAETSASDDPEAVKDIQPWGSVGKDEKGNKGIFIGSGEGRALAAHIEQPAIGTQGVGKYKPAMTDGEMDAAGFSAPPLHGHCRSTIIPVFSDVAAPPIEAPPAPVAAPPLPAPPPAPAPVAAVPTSAPREDADAALARLAYAESMANASAALLADASDLAAQKELREASRTFLEAQGLHSVDDELSLPQRDNLVIKKHKEMAGATANHWRDSGRVEFQDHAFARATNVFQDAKANPARYASGEAYHAENALSSVRVFLHEELHGCSRMKVKYWSPTSTGIEEASTEILARKMTREFAGPRGPGAKGGQIFPEPIFVTRRDLPPLRRGGTDFVKIPRHTAGAGSYNEYIEGVYAAVGHVTGTENIQARIEAALFATRSTSAPGGRQWQTGRDQIEAFVDNLGIRLNVQRNRLVDMLDDPKGPLAKDLTDKQTAAWLKRHTPAPNKKP
jgi:hypothetical protein